jgi:hypothetical protein
MFWHSSLAGRKVKTDEFGDMKALFPACVIGIREAMLVAVDGRSDMLCAQVAASRNPGR